MTTSAGAPVADNQNSQTAGPRGPVLLQDYQLIEKLAHQNRERIPERVVHAKGWGAYGTFRVTHDIASYTRAAIFAKVGKETPLLVRFSTVAGELGAADAERDVRGFALKFYTEEGNWDSQPTPIRRLWVIHFARALSTSRSSCMISSARDIWRANAGLYGVSR